MYTCGVLVYVCVNIASRAQQRVLYELRRVFPVWELAACESGAEHSKLQNKQCVAKNGVSAETRPSRALQGFAANREIDRSNYVQREA